MSKRIPLSWVALTAGMIWGGVIVGLPPSGAASNSGTLSAADRKFVMSAAQGGMAEVQLGQLAAKNGSADSVKQFGQRMVDDHSKANDELKQLASSKGITLPSAANRKQRQTYNHLSHLTAASFDRAYAADMVKDHEMDVREFEKESTNASDPDVKAWAAKTLPTLQEHLRMARALPSASTQ
jgi:putative membrane protein